MAAVAPGALSSGHFHADGRCALRSTAGSPSGSKPCIVPMKAHYPYSIQGRRAMRWWTADTMSKAKGSQILLFQNYARYKPLSFPRFPLVRQAHLVYIGRVAVGNFHGAARSVEFGQIRPLFFSPLLLIKCRSSCLMHRCHIHVDLLLMVNPNL